MFDFYRHIWDPVIVRTAYRCRAYPDQTQQAVLNRTFGCVGVVWNRTLAARHARSLAKRKGTWDAETDPSLTATSRAPNIELFNPVASAPLTPAFLPPH